MNCRFCRQPLKHVFIDLYHTPISNSFLRPEQLELPEVTYPLKTFVCDKCFLVQIDEYKKSSEIFDSEYVYFSSFSKSWLDHCKQYVDMMINRFQLTNSHNVIEIASNDGYLLQYFKNKNIPVLGIEPTANTAAVAKSKGIETIIDFFGTQLAGKIVRDGKMADVLLGNNVLAHVPDIVDFVKGMKMILAPMGVITIEFPHLYELVKNNQFDTIYHEHFSYLSLYTVKSIFESCGLKIFDVEQLSTHGGSLRIFACHLTKDQKDSINVKEILSLEENAGMKSIAYYENFTEQCVKIKNDFVSFLIECKSKGKIVVAYGAAAKGNTLLAYSGVRADLISFVVDANPTKQNLFLPFSHIPVVEESLLKKIKPDFIIIFPWNIKSEIMQQLDYTKAWGAKFVTAIPSIQIQ